MQRRKGAKNSGAKSELNLIILEDNSNSGEEGAEKEISIAF